MLLSVALSFGLTSNALLRNWGISTIAAIQSACATHAFCGPSKPRKFEVAAKPMSRCAVHVRRVQTCHAPANTTSNLSKCAPAALWKGTSCVSERSPEGTALVIRMPTAKLVTSRTSPNAPCTASNTPRPLAPTTWQASLRTRNCALARASHPSVSASPWLAHFPQRGSRRLRGGASLPTQKEIDASTTAATCHRHQLLPQETTLDG